MTVEQFLGAWLASSETRVRPRTHEHYAWLINTHLIPSIGRRQLEKLTPTDVEALLASKLKAGLSPRSCHHLRSLLRNALNRAVRDRLVLFNAAALADPLKVPRQEITVLSSLQARALLEAAKGNRLEALYVTALGLGLREGEVLGLRWQDVDLVAGILRINVALQRRSVPGQRDKEFTLVEPKSKTSRRALLLSDRVRQTLIEHRDRQLEERRQARLVNLDQWGLVFTGQYGEPLESRAVLRQFRELLERAGLPQIRFHDLRHSCASLLLAEKVPAKVVQSILGHSSYHLTMDTYSHVLPQLQEEAAAAQERILGS